jgi:hypothetical protein
MQEFYTSLGNEFELVRTCRNPRIVQKGSRVVLDTGYQTLDFTANLLLHVIFGRWQELGREANQIDEPNNYPNIVHNSHRVGFILHCRLNLTA